MVKKVKKSASKKPVIKPPHRPCSQQPCKKTSAYCRVEGKKGKVSYCADHWKSVVESKKEFAQAVVRHAKAQAALRQSKPKKKIRKRVKK